MLAACNAHVLIDLQGAWKYFPVEYLVNATLTVQPELVAMHAASLRIGNAGLLLAGLSHSGKTTTALHLAARGHTLLGDEAALIRLGANEILPFRRTVHLRSGPRTPELLAVLGRLAGRHESPVDGEGIRPLRISALFPGSSACPVSLRAVFFLGGFAVHPSLRPFRPTLHDLDTFGALAGNEIATLWGLTPARRALRVLALRQLLARLPCWLLQVGTPLETAELIERTMEGLGC
jgi:hypothetical protein